VASKDMFSLESKTAIVTGASSGLGVTFAKTLADAGANVVLAARRKDNLDALVAEIEAAGGHALAVQCDVTDSTSVRDLVDAARQQFGRVDVLVNNAGGSADAGFVPEKIPDELFAQTIQVNLMGTFYCAREVAQHMLTDGRGGSIINIASIMGMAGQQNAPTAYQASKGAVINLTRNLACSWADRGVRVNCIAPGWFPSELTAGWLGVPQFLARFTDQAPMQRTGNPEELAGPLLFLASDASSFVTGTVLPVDGGVHAAGGATPYSQELHDTHAAMMGEAGTRLMPKAKG
jgi:NAD(P)-dependent dehydrogenase (short-subunit alcohol dehydrogenase family)